MFNEPELQVLISGSSQGGKLDIDDVKANTKHTDRHVDQLILCAVHGVCRVIK